MERNAEYGDLTLTYEIEGDVDGAHANILQVTDEAGQPKNIDHIHPGTIEDMKFICVSEFNSIVHKHYMATGETLDE